MKKPLLESGFFIGHGQQDLRVHQAVRVLSLLRAVHAVVPQAQCPVPRVIWQIDRLADSFVAAHSQLAGKNHNKPAVMIR